MEIYIFYHICLHFPFVNILFITFIFILLYRIIMTPDRDLDLGFSCPPLIVPSHPASSFLLDFIVYCPGSSPLSPYINPVLYKQNNKICHLPSITLVIF